jgi:hypothetical protein
MAYRAPLTWFKRSLKEYRRNARVSGHKWSLSEAQFKSLIHEPCHYCGEPPKRLTPIVKGERRITQEKFSGIDRVDSRDGYSVSNCVPCCKDCNFAKRVLSQSDFIAHCEKVLRHWTSKNK